MSTAAWEGPLAPNHDTNGAFGGTIDPSAMDFNASPDFDFGQMQGTPTPIPQHMQNGIRRNGSPAAFQQPSYQPSSVVPAKRPHNDSYSGSPRQPSRSITPQQAQFPQQFPNAVNGQQPGTNGYQNFVQVNSTAASPSPVMPNQPFNVPAGGQQRMQTASPSPFSPAATNAGIQMSPASSDFSNHAEPVQNGMGGFPQGNPYMNGHAMGSPSFMPNGNTMMQHGAPMGHAVVPGTSNVDPQEHQRQMMAMRQAAMHRQSNGMVTGPQRPGGMPGQQNVPPQIQQINAHFQKQISDLKRALIQPVPLEQFNGMVDKFNKSRGASFDPNLVVCGRPILPGNFFGIVMQHGGARMVAQRQLWPLLTQKLSINVQQFPSGPQELINYWQSNLVLYEHHLLTQHNQKVQTLQMHHRQQVAQMQTALAGRQGRPPQAGMPGMPSMPNSQTPNMMHMRRPSGPDSQGPPQMSPGVYPGQAAGFNQTPQPRPGTQGSMTMTVPPPPQPRATPNRPPAKRMPSAAQSEIGLKENEPSAAPVQERGPPRYIRPDVFEPRVFAYGKGYGDMTLENHGHLKLADEKFWKTIEEVEFWRRETPSLHMHPPHPQFGEGATPNMGAVDIHNITMAIKSGIAAEVRVALDILSQLAKSPYNPDIRNPHLVYYTLPLDECDDLLEALVDYGEEQVDLLAENAEELSDDIVLYSYEDRIRHCKQENMDLTDPPQAGTDAYDLERTAERVSCIMSILQNLSCGDDRMVHSRLQEHHLGNIRQLTESFVIRYVSNVIRYIGTRKMLLRSHRNTLDFCKDALLFLSNIALDLELPGKDETLCILLFLLSFGPSPFITSSEDGHRTISFSTQDPGQHRYLRFAIDTLAKLLARDEPNRTYFRSIFTADAPYDLLTHAFGLAIAPIPGEMKQKFDIIQWRQGYMAQGLLAADILAGILPSDASSLAQLWLHSPDGWTNNLLRLVVSLGIEHPPQPQNTLIDPGLHMSMVERGLNVLQQLAERSRDADGSDDKKQALKVSRLAGRELMIKALKLDAYLQLTGVMTQQQVQMTGRMFVRRVLKQLNSLMDLEA